MYRGLNNFYLDHKGVHIGRPYGCHVTGKIVTTIDERPIIAMQCDGEQPGHKGYRMIEMVKKKGDQKLVIVRDKTGMSQVRIPISKKNSLSKYGYRLGFVQDERRHALMKATKAYGPALVFKRLLALRNMREVPGVPGPSPPRAKTRTGDEWRRIDNDMSFIKKKYNPDFSRK